MEKNYDFSGYVTKNNIRCTDGRIIRQDAFAHLDGEIVPLVWSHSHNDPTNVIGKVVLENRTDGVYGYGQFNSSDKAKHAREAVRHGDITSMSIWANQLRQNGPDVLHGSIKEVSLVVAGANPGAVIDTVMIHGQEMEDQAIIFTGEDFSLYHSDDDKDKNENKDEKVENKDDNKDEKDNDKTISDVLKTFNEEQEKVLYYIVGKALEDDSKGGNEDVKHNLFEREEEYTNDAVLSHSDQTAILALAKSNSVGSFQDAMARYIESDDTLSHAFDDETLDQLFPEYKDVRPGAPELIERDQGWVSVVMNKVHKSPISRIRTRQADVRGEEFRAKGYQKGKFKNTGPNIPLLKRTTDPQTVYRKDALHRDDIVDITDFDVVEYQYRIMKNNLNEEIARAIMIGDGRDDGDEDKIYEDKIRPIWKDDELYTIHRDVDKEAMKTTLQGTNTSANFGDNYITAEAIITEALYAREKYKGSGNLEFYCTPHMLNVMLLARDLNGRRIYNSVTDIAAALNVSAIHTAEQFENQIRTDNDGNKHKLLGLFVNLSDYHVGSTRGGEITRFNQFDIDFNQEKYLIETRLSGALTRVYSAIALEEPVA